MKSRILPMLSILAFSVLLATTNAIAATLSFSFLGTGETFFTAPPAGSNLFVNVQNTAYTLDATSGWTLDAPLTYDLATQTGVGTFAFSRGSDGLSGTFTSAGIIGSLPGGGQGLVGFDLTYAVLDGSGIFGGASGTGSSTASFTGETGYLESGRFGLIVPEPRTLALLGLGLAGLGLGRKRKLA